MQRKHAGHWGTDAEARCHAGGLWATPARGDLVGSLLGSLRTEVGPGSYTVFEKGVDRVVFLFLYSPGKKLRSML